MRISIESRSESPIGSRLVYNATKKQPNAALLKTSPQILKNWNILHNPLSSKRNKFVLSKYTYESKISNR